MNLAYIAALDGYRTLIWDMDSQAASTFYFRLKPKIKGGAEKLLSGKKMLDASIKATDYALLDILPADDSMRHQDVLLDGENKPQKRIAKLLKPLAEEYDYIFIDCPPSMSLTSESVFVAADLVLIPTIPSTLSLLTLDKVYDFFKDGKLSHNKLLAFFSMVDNRRTLHKQTVASPPEKYRFAKAVIPSMSDIEKMGISKQPACAMPRNKAQACYLALWQELKGRL